MQRVRKISLFLLVLLSALSLVVLPASAHPGKTDSDGGHYDREEDEYHYHHGYEAHSHYDMDGDGYVDCPYNFNDKTGWNSGSSSSSSGSNSSFNSSYKKDVYHAPSETKTTSKANEEAKLYIPKWIGWMIAFLVASIACLFIFCRSRTRDLSYYKSAYEDEKAKSKSELASQRESYERKYGLKISELESKTAKLEKERFDLSRKNKELSNQLSIAKNRLNQFEAIQEANLTISPEELGIPESIYFVDKIYPTCGEITKLRPYGDLTVYTARSGHR